MFEFLNSSMDSMASVLVSRTQALIVEKGKIKLVISLKELQPCIYKKSLVQGNRPYRLHHLKIVACLHNSKRFFFDQFVYDKILCQSKALKDLFSNIFCRNVVTLELELCSDK